MKRRQWCERRGWVVELGYRLAQLPLSCCMSHKDVLFKLTIMCASSLAFVLYMQLYMITKSDVSAAAFKTHAQQSYTNHHPPMQELSRLFTNSGIQSKQSGDILHRIGSARNLTNHQRHSHIPITNKTYYLTYSAIINGERSGKSSSDSSRINEDDSRSLRSKETGLDWHEKVDADDAGGDHRFDKHQRSAFIINKKANDNLETPRDNYDEDMRPKEDGDSTQDPILPRAEELDEQSNQEFRTDDTQVERDDDSPFAVDGGGYGSFFPWTVRVDANSSLANIRDKSNLCPEIPPGLVGLIPIFWDASSYDELVREHRELIRGGRWRPKSCTARHRVAIIVPYRDRDVHLRKLLQHLHPFLQKQQLDYAIYVIEQEDSSSKFNRAMLFNIGYKEALQLHEYDCVIFHDVDLLPEDDRNIYACPQPKEPRHMTAAIDKFKYKLPYAGLFGGASAIRVEDFKTVNGFSNLYFGWGAEDDDMFERLQMGGMQIKRYPMHIARYKAMPHEPASTYNDRYKYLKTMQTRYDKDGINNLKYKRLSLRELPLYTWVHVRLNETQVREDFPIPRVNQVPKALDFDNMAEWGTDGKDETLEGSEWEAPSYRTIVNGSAIRHLLPNTNTITNRPKSDVNGTKPRLSPPGDRETDDTPSRHRKRYSRTRRKLRNGRSKGGEAELDELIADLRKKQGKIT